MASIAHIRNKSFHRYLEQLFSRALQSCTTRSDRLATSNSQYSYYCLFLYFLCDPARSLCKSHAHTAQSLSICRDLLKGSKVHLILRNKFGNTLIENHDLQLRSVNQSLKDQQYHAIYDFRLLSYLYYCGTESTAIINLQIRCYCLNIIHLLLQISFGLTLYLETTYVPRVEFYSYFFRGYWRVAHESRVANLLFN